MNFIIKTIKALLKWIFPSKIYNFFEGKFSKTKRALTGTEALRVFWKILFFPICFAFDLLIALVKILLAWILPSDLYEGLGYLYKQFLSDLCEKKLGLKLSIKRFNLTAELFAKGGEKKVSFGEKNPDKTFYVIRPYYYVAPNELLTHPQHLLFYYYLILQKISYAVNKHWIPVVDLENYDGLLYFAEPEPVHGTKNAWEYFWKQPSEYTLEEVYQSKNVVLSTRNSKDYGFIPPTLMKRPFDKYAQDLANRCSKYAHYTQFEENTEKYILDWERELFPENARILGVVYRSTSYGSAKTPNSSHPVQPSLMHLVERVKELLCELQMEYVFFVNEEEENVHHMQQEFGEKLIVLPRKRYSQFHEFTKDDPNPLYVFGQRHPTNLSYLTEIALLSKCTGLVGAMSSGTRAAIIWNANKYEFMEIIDLGLW